MISSVAELVIGLAQRVQAMDIALFRLINQGGAHPALDPVMVVATQMGLGGAQLAVLLLPLTFGGRAGRRTALLCVLALVISGIAVQVLKMPVDRFRPALVVEECRSLLDVTRFHSFPSGHTATSFALAVVAGGRHRRWAVPLLLFAGLVGYSRVYVGAHFPTDVLGGMLLGIAVGVACLHEDRMAPPAAPGTDGSSTTTAGAATC